MIQWQMIQWQMIQWPKEKGQKDKQWYTTTLKNKDWTKLILQKNCVWTQVLLKGNCSCSNSDTRRVILINIGFLSHLLGINDTLPMLQRYCSRISGVMVSVLASSAVDRGFEPRSGQAKDYKIGICCFSTKHAELRRKSKDWLQSCRKSSDISDRRTKYWLGPI